MAAPPVSPTTPRPGFVDYVATRTVRDLSCGLAGERTFNDNREVEHPTLQWLLRKVR